MRRLLAALALVFAPAGSALAAGADQVCRPDTFEGARYTVCTADPAQLAIRVFWKSGTGSPYGSFSALADDARRTGLDIRFAMNGGMYQEDLSPVGLYVENGQTLKKANTRSGPGNFHMKPNGVFYVAGQRAGVLTTDAYLKAPPKADFATQSGPMLVIDGAIHPAFKAASESEKIRNGVGVGPEGLVHFVVSDDAVTFHEFARYFRDRLGDPNALFLDGSISSLYAPDLDRADSWFPMGPIVAAVSRKPL